MFTYNVEWEQQIADDIEEENATIDEKFRWEWWRQHIFYPDRTINLTDDK